jgi:hypothetical protein
MFTLEKPFAAPGCFGSPLTYKSDSVECSPCPFKEQCGDFSSKSLKHLRDQLGIPIPKKQRAFEAQEEGSIGMAPPPVPKKVQELLDRFERSGLKITDALIEGRNPFKSKPEFMRVTCHLLLNLKCGINQEMLRCAFQIKMEWTQGTAVSHAKQAIQTLEALGAIEKRGNNYHIRQQTIG